MSNEQETPANQQHLRLRDDPMGRNRAFLEQRMAKLRPRDEMTAVHYTEFKRDNLVIDADNISLVIFHTPEAADAAAQSLELIKEQNDPKIHVFTALVDSPGQPVTIFGAPHVVSSDGFLCILYCRLLHIAIINAGQGLSEEALVGALSIARSAKSK